MSIGDCKYLERVLECINWERVDIPDDNDTRLKILRIKHELGLSWEGVVVFDSKKGVAVYKFPEQKQYK